MLRKLILIGWTWSIWLVLIGTACAGNSLNGRYTYNSYNYNSEIGSEKSIIIDSSKKQYIGWHTIEELHICDEGESNYCFHTVAFGFCVPKNDSIKTGGEYECGDEKYSVLRATTMNVFGVTTKVSEITTKAADGTTITFYFSYEAGLVAVKFDGKDKNGSMYYLSGKTGFPFDPSKGVKGSGLLPDRP